MSSSSPAPVPVWRIVIAATGVELALAAVGATALGLIGAVSRRLDALNNLAPIWCVLAAISLPLLMLGLERRRARTVLTSLALAALLLNGGPILWDLSRREPATPQAGADPLKVVTFNASAESYSADLAADAVLRADPDLVALQEPFVALGAADRFAARYPYSATCPAAHSCPLAIWSKRPILKSGFVVKRPGEAGWNDIDFLWVETTAPDGGRVVLATSHLLWPVPAYPQAVQRDALAGRLASLPRRDLIFTGDLNSAPWTFAMRRLDARLRPLTRRTRALMTWPAFVPRVFLPVTAPFLAIDHVYAGPAWATAGVRSLGRAASDHYPVEVTLTRRKPPS